MGCDIHLWVERKPKTSNAKRWQIVTPTEVKNGDLDENDRERAKYKLQPTIYDGRNYDLFAMLANVRNGLGFAGSVTGEGFTPILRGQADPDNEHVRGVPRDASAEYARIARQWDADGHSHNWLTLAELKAYDWQGQKTAKYGVVDAAQFKVWQEKGAPVHYSGAGGSRVKKVSVDEMKRLIAEGMFDFDKPLASPWDHPPSKDGNIYYTIVEWGESYAEAAGSFLTVTIPWLDAYAKRQDIADTDLRIVFFFDN